MKYCVVVVGAEEGEEEEEGEEGEGEAVQEGADPPLKAELELVGMLSAFHFVKILGRSSLVIEQILHFTSRFVHCPVSIPP